VGLEGGEREFTVAAPPSACFAAILDFESYPEWQGPVQSCEVLERDEEGRGSLVETVVDLKIRRARYVLRYEYDEPRLARWTFVEGDPKDVAGEFAFEDDGSGGTRGVYRQAIDVGRLGLLARGPAKQGFLKLLLDDAVNDLKARVE
jgi:Polyketide cyclase / dehydrase and lipid transport